MSIDTKTKQDLIKKFARKENDTGSPEVQVAILTTRITNLSEERYWTMSNLRTKIDIKL